MTLATGGSMTDHITITRALLKQAMNALLLPCDRWNAKQFKIVTAAAEALRAALAAPASKPLFAELIAQHEGLAEELAAMDVPPAWHDAPETIALQLELASAKAAYLNACKLIADMHAAAVGEVTGPRLGVVEDVVALRAERDAAMKDAERYRWLRSQHWSDGQLSVVVNAKENVRLGANCPSHELLDVAIDAAIAKAEGGAA